MSSENNNNISDPGVMEVTGRVLIATIIALVVVLILLFMFHIYARWLWHRRQQAGFNAHPNSREPHHPGVTTLRRGLDAAFLKTIPVTLFDSSKDVHHVEVECSVCLCELEQGDKTRILPKCNHVFHAECIDMWFHSHSTCPVCRNLVSEETQEISVESLLEINHGHDETREGQEDHNHNNGEFPTNVLFWGDETEVSTLTSQLVDNQLATVLPFEPPAAATAASSSSSSQTINIKSDDRLKPDLVIDIPRQLQQEEMEDDSKSTPIMRSLRRILSSGRRFNPFSPGSTSEQAQT